MCGNLNWRAPTLLTHSLPNRLLKLTQPLFAMAIRTLFASVALAAFLTTSVDAASISILNVAMDMTGTTADQISGTARNQSTSSLTNSGGTVSGGVGASVNAGGRFAASVSAKETTVDFANFPTATSDFNASFIFSFDVIAEAATDWSLLIENLRLGELSVVDDDLDGAGFGTASISESTATINDLGEAALSLAAASSGALNQTSSTTLAGSGNQSFTLKFVWSAQATSTSAFFTDGDSAAVMLGLDAVLDHVNDYPRAGSVVASDDGHFVNVTATITSIAAIPEPTGGALLAFVVGGVATVTRRRRK